MAFSTVLHPKQFIRFFLLYASPLALLLFLSQICLCHGEAEIFAESHRLNHNFDGHVVSIASLLQENTNCSTSSSKGTSSESSLTILHRHNPCLGPSLMHSREKAAKSREQLLKHVLLQDQNRVDSLQLSLSNKVDQIERAKKTILPAHSGRSLGSANYVVRVGFGTPREDLSLIFDTGSDFTWIQCAPCARSCYDQQDPIFSPSKSKSYSNISCSSKPCSELRSATSVDPQCSSSTCVYGIQYGDQSFSVGFFASETITLNTDVFPNFFFGCGQNNRGLFGSTAGLIGLGRNPLSLVSQTAGKYGQFFSYCLPSTTSATGSLTFGNPGKISPSVQFTPLLSNSKEPSFYFLNFVGISVGGTQLPISASVFATGGTIIDSGTVITRLPPEAYAALRTAFRKLMAKYPLGKPLSILDTCYDLSGYSSITVPKIALLFGGNVAVNVDGSGILIAASLSQVCLAFAANEDAGDVTILGNMQQQKLDVIYDLGKGRIGFGPGSCS